MAGDLASVKPELKARPGRPERNVAWTAAFSLGPLDGWETSFVADPGEVVYARWPGFGWHRYLLGRKCELGRRGGGVARYLLFEHAGGAGVGREKT